MDIGAILLFLSVLVVTVWFIARPFIEKHPRHSTTSGHELSSLLAERDRVIMSLQELDFDNSLGKIPAEEYTQQRAELMQHGAEVLRRIDELSPKKSSSRDAETRIEAAIAIRRADSAVTSSRSTGDADDELESLIAARRSERKEKTGGFCPNCGRPILLADRFCPNCGKVIK